MTTTLVISCNVRYCQSTYFQLLPHKEFLISLPNQPRSTSKLAHILRNVNSINFKAGTMKRRSRPLVAPVPRT